MLSTASHYRDYSRGHTDIVPTVTPTYVLPHDLSYYQTFASQDACGTRQELNEEAVAAAAAAGYAVSSYARVMVHFPKISTLNKGRSWSDIKGKRLWMNGNFDWRLAAHELGHSYGCWHANRWIVTDGNPVSPPLPAGTGQPDPNDYGDSFDVMGHSWDKGPENDFNEDYKRQLGWITGSQIKTVTQTNTYKIYAFDNPASLPNGTTSWLGLKFYKDAKYDYWVGYRRAFTTNNTLSNGAYVTWVEKAFVRSELIDWVPSTDYQDAAVPLTIPNSILTDGGISIKPVGNGTDSGGDWLRVRVVIP